MRETIRKILIAVCLVALCFVSYKVGSFWWEIHNEKQQDEQIVSDYKNSVNGAETSSKEPEEKAPFTPDAGTYAYMHGINSDYAGWLKWDSNIINTYLLHPKAGEEDRYLYNNIYGRRTYGGSAFIDSSSVVGECQNLMIYGHSVFATETQAIPMMFSPMRNMLDQSYFNANRTFKIYWENEIDSYEVFAVSLIDTDTCDWQYTRSYFDSDEEVNEWLAQAKSLSSVTGSVDVSPQDTFVTFQTCMYRTGTQRVVVTAKKTGSSSY